MPLVIICSQHFFEAPQVGETRYLAPASRIEVPGHRSSWRPRRHLLTAGALQPRRGHLAPPSGAACRLRRFFPETRLAAVGFRRARAQRPMRRGRRKWWACIALYPFKRQRNDECFGLQAKYIYIQTFKASFLQHYILLK